MFTIFPNDLFSRLFVVNCAAYTFVHVKNRMRLEKKQKSIFCIGAIVAISSNLIECFFTGEIICEMIGFSY